MNYRCRAMRPKDVLQCVEIIAGHPVLGRRYRKRMAELREAWLLLLNCDAKTAIVFEELDGSRAQIWGFGVSVFVRDEFVREMKTPPYVWIGPELAKRIAGGNSPVLNFEELRQANASGGLNMVVWEGCIRPSERKESDDYNKIMAYFMEEHRGYRWKEIISLQSESGERLRAMLKAGALLWEPSSGRWTDSAKKSLDEIVRAPHVTGLSREPASRRPGSWADSLFEYQPPRIGFTRSEQQLLVQALQGGTDEELSDELPVSLSTIKKTWRAIYGRAAIALPELIPAQPSTDFSPRDRGKEKKQRLITYLREHPEELRPVSRKMLAKSPGRMMQK